MRLATARQLLALGIVAFAAFHFFSQVEDFGLRALWDPATLLYPLALSGLAFRLFWGRWLTICFSLSLLIIQLLQGRFHGDLWWLAIALKVAVILLLSGASMRAIFEGRRSRLNRWAGENHPRVERLRWLVLAQTVALAVLCGRIAPAPTTLAIFGLAGVGLLGLTLQRTWALPVLLATTALEAWALGAFSVEVVQFGGSGIFGVSCVVLLCAAVVLSLALLVPLLVLVLWRP